MEKNEYSVICPNCKFPFSIESALEQKLSDKMRAEIEEAAKKKAEEEVEAKSKILQKDIEDKKMDGVLWHEIAGLRRKCCFESVSYRPYRSSRQGSP